MLYFFSYYLNLFLLINEITASSTFIGVRNEGCFSFGLILFVLYNILLYIVKPKNITIEDNATPPIVYKNLNAVSFIVGVLYAGKAVIKITATKLVNINI